MAGQIEKRMKALGIALPPAAKAIGLYASHVVTGNQVWSCQGSLHGEELRYCGRLGQDLSVADGQAAARLTALNLLMQVKDACGGDLDRLRKVVRLVGYINATPEFTQFTQVMNGASEVLIAILGEAGRSARVAVGCSSLPANLAVEIDGVFEIAPKRRKAAARTKRPPLGGRRRNR
ncbi:MAG: RidA family protein [Alphaproteobacteria bacterium]